MKPPPPQVNLYSEIWFLLDGDAYMGADKAAAFGERNSVPGELLVRLTPTKIIAQKDLAGW